MMLLWICLLLSVFVHIRGEKASSGASFMDLGDINDDIEGINDDIEAINDDIEAINDEIEECENDDPDLSCFLNDMKRYEVGNGINTRDLHTPVFMIPSFAGTRLRTWSNLECGLASFKIGGTVWLDVKRMVANTKCWMNCMKLDPETQEDAMCMTRADEGVDAVTQVDETLPTGLDQIGFLWKSAIHMMASNGREPEKSMFAHPYDWRLPPAKMQERDATFSKLRRRIEDAVALHEERNQFLRHHGVALIGFSLGNNFIQYFFNYLKAELGERGMERWANQHIATLIMCASPFLGAPGPIQALIGGDAAGLPISNEQSREIMLTYGSSPWMFPSNTKVRHPRHVAMNHGEADFPTQLFEITMRNGTVLRPENGDIVEEGGWLGKMGDPKLDSVQRIIDRWYLNDPNIDESIFEPWTPPKGIDQVICLYGVNAPTPVGYKYRAHPKYDGYYEETDVFTNDKGDILSKRGEQVLPEHRRFATRKSGDGSVPYYSLSWCHSWFGSDRVNITRMPAQKAYEEDDVEKYSNVDLLDPAQLADTERRPHGYDTFYHRTWVEESPKTRLQRRRSIQVWELDGIIHRDSVSDPRLLGMLQKVLTKAGELTETYVTAYDRMIKYARENLDRSGRVDANWFEEIAREGASWSQDKYPTTDAECYWDYANVKCAWTRYCVYKYHITDLTLSQSCRLREEPLEKDDPLLLGDTVAHNVSYNVSNRVEWRTVYREKPQGILRPWQVVFLSFVGGFFFLAIILYFIFNLYSEEILAFLKHRSSKLRGTIFRSIGWEVALEKEVSLLKETLDGLEAAMNDDQKTEEDIKDSSSHGDESTPEPSGLPEDDIVETVEHLRKRIRRLSQTPQVRHLSQLRSSQLEAAQAQALSLVMEDDDEEDEDQEKKKTGDNAEGVPSTEKKEEMESSGSQEGGAERKKLAKTEVSTQQPQEKGHKEVLPRKADTI